MDRDYRAHQRHSESGNSLDAGWLLRRMRCGELRLEEVKAGALFDHPAARQLFKGKSPVPATNARELAYGLFRIDIELFLKALLRGARWSYRLLHSNPSTEGILGITLRESEKLLRDLPAGFPSESGDVITRARLDAHSERVINAARRFRPTVRATWCAPQRGDDNKALHREIFVHISYALSFSAELVAAAWLSRENLIQSAGGFWTTRKDLCELGGYALGHAIDAHAKLASHGLLVRSDIEKARRAELARLKSLLLDNLTNI